MKNWKKEFSRDLLALGSIIFYVLVLGRSLIGPYWPFVVQLTLSGIVLFLIYLFYKKADYYTGRALILLYFTSLFYKDLVYSLFASFVFILIFVSSYFVGNKIKNIVYGVVFGIVASLISFYLSPYVLGMF